VRSQLASVDLVSECKDRLKFLVVSSFYPFPQLLRDHDFLDLSYASVVFVSFKLGDVCNQDRSEYFNLFFIYDLMSLTYSSAGFSVDLLSLIHFELFVLFVNWVFKPSTLIFASSSASELPTGPSLIADLRVMVSWNHGLRLL
jgi:hypothetical protein